MAFLSRKERFHDVGQNQDQRTQFQRDRDRILYTSAFRRLAWVTQVVSSEEGEPFHNRLTHTLEVAQIGRRLAEKFLVTQEKTAEKLGGIDPDVVEAAALAHDLGHPPFGHNAEKQLNESIRFVGVPEGFEGNAQSFRIVTKLAVRYTESRGLNLTRATLNAILKYPWLWRDRRPGYPEKWGAYESEVSEFEWVRRYDSHESGKSVEASTMDLADDIAYAVHDVEDFYRAGLIPLERLARDDEEAGKFVDYASQKLKSEEHIPPLETDECKGILLKALKRYGIDEPYSGTRGQRAKLRSMTSEIIGRYVQSSKLDESDSGDHQLVVLEDEQLMKELLIFKQLPWHYVIDGAALASQQYGQRRIIGELFDIFYREIKAGSRRLFPEGYREQLNISPRVGQAAGKEDHARVVADLVAGMTEPQAIAMHHRLTGVSLGTVMSSIVR